MTHPVEGPVEHIVPQALDRTALATGMRRAGICVDFNDWDGLDDDEVRQRVQYSGLSYGARPDGRIVYHPEEQAAIVVALASGDQAMLGRAYIHSLFTDLTGNTQ